MKLKRTKHELFLREYIRLDQNGTQAYINIYGCTNYGAAAASASRLLAGRRFPEVRKRYDELRMQMAKKADITIDKVLTDYQHALDLAKAKADPNAIVNAASAQAKLVGLLKDRLETGGPGDFDNIDNVNEILERVASEAGEDVALALANAMGLVKPQMESLEEADLIDIEPASDTLN